MIERAYLFLASMGTILIFGLLFLLYQCLKPYFGMIGQALAFLIVTFVVCLALAIGFSTYWLIRFLQAKVEDLDYNSRLVAHGDTAIYVNKDGTIYHMSAVHAASEVTGQVLESAGYKIQSSIANNPHSYDNSEIGQGDKVRNLLSLGLSQREIEKQYGISRYQQKKLLD